MKRSLAPLLACALLFSACPEAGREAAAGWVAALQLAHQRADELLAEGKLDGARAYLEDALELPVPPAVSEADRRAARQDLCYRLSELALEAGRPEVALELTARGLAEGCADDLFCANLQVSRGRSLERLGRPGEASEAYHRALTINERLLKAAVGRGEEGR